MIDPLWGRASYERYRRSLGQGDHPVALLVSEDVGALWIKELDRLSGLYLIGAICSDIPIGSIGRYEGVPVYVAPWLAGKSFAWAWPPKVDA